MMMSETTPRISAQYLEQFSHKSVRLIGKVGELRGDEATIDAGGNVKLHLSRDSHLQLGHAVEVIGKVQNDLSVRVLLSTDLGPASAIDFNAVEAVVDATHRYHELFYTKD
ncbi:hypothetical protein AMS68_000491 [Peltaster fructicola]|uniref:Replication factor A protein 3 n=1 Tax=Peltaster fructicola TaxID=286661 RepID=A0A6H0XJS8_9PEZI|nr:hypothetical protein AMS68_000491 [Peltaster fructicola]